MRKNARNQKYTFTLDEVALAFALVEKVDPDKYPSTRVKALIYKCRETREAVKSGQSPTFEILYDQGENMNTFLKIAGMLGLYLTGYFGALTVDTSESLARSLLIFVGCFVGASIISAAYERDQKGNDTMSEQQDGIETIVMMKPFFDRFQEWVRSQQLEVSPRIDLEDSECGPFRIISIPEHRVKEVFGTQYF